MTSLQKGDLTIANMRVVFNMSACDGSPGATLSAARLSSALHRAGLHVRLTVSHGLENVTPEMQKTMLGSDTFYEVQRCLIGSRSPSPTASEKPHDKVTLACQARPDKVILRLARGSPVTVDANLLYSRVDTDQFYPDDDNLRPQLSIPETLTGLIILSDRPVDEENLVAVVAALTESHRWGRPWALIVKALSPVREFNRLVRDACARGQISRRWWLHVKKTGYFCWLDQMLDLTEMRMLYNTVDFLLKPAQRFTTGAAIAEATACGVPCIIGAHRLPDTNPLVMRLPKAFHSDAQPSAVEIGEAVFRLGDNEMFRITAVSQGPRYARENMHWAAAAEILQSLVRLIFWQQELGSPDFFVG